MTDRMKLLEAVADVVRAWCSARNDLNGAGSTLHDTQAIFDALAALDALPAQPQGENVTLAVWQGPHGNAVLAVPGTVADRDDDRPWTRLGAVTLPLNTEPQP